MDVNFYIDRLEQSFDDPTALLQIQAQAREDSGLDDDERQLVDSRAGTYLADLETQGEIGPGVFDEDDSDASAP